MQGIRHIKIEEEKKEEEAEIIVIHLILTTISELGIIITPVCR